MSDKLDAIMQQVQPKRNFERPPLHLWHPTLSGDIAIRILEDGRWLHEGDEITRQSLVRLFASILRREDDGEYYLVTPGEKWRLQIDLHALQVVDVEARQGDNGQELWVRLNTGAELLVTEPYTLAPEPRREGVAVLQLWHGLSALFSRAAWYRLVALADEHGGVESCGQRFQL
jgi:hypothetical protein